MPRIVLPDLLGSIEVPAGWRKPCRRAQWNEGVRVVAEPAFPAQFPFGAWKYDEVPIGVTADGSGGAFVLATRRETWPWSQGACSLRYLPASGVAGPLVDLEPPYAYVGIIGVWGEAAMVATGRRGVIVASADQTTLLAARAFDERGRLRWSRLPRGRALSLALMPNTSSRVVNLAGEPDGHDGAIFAWRAVDADGVTRTRAQRIDSKGRLVWPRDGVMLPVGTGAAWPPPQAWTQLVGTGDGGAVVVAAEAAGAAFRLVAVDVTPKGGVGAATTIVAGTSDGLASLQRLRHAVPDRAGGLFLAYADANGALRLLRYTPTLGVRWDVAIANLTASSAFWIREDGRGGALVGWLDGTAARLALQRVDGQGAVTWTAGTAPLAMPVTIGMPAAAGTWDRTTWARLVQPLPDGGGGALVVFQSWATGATQPELWSCCFGPDGLLVNGPLPLSSRASGKFLPVAADVAGESAIVAWSDDGALATDGLDCWAQRIACCPPQQELPPPPPFGCEILPLPGTLPGEIAVQLPCGNETRSFGVIPLSRFLGALPGLGLPGALVHRGTPPPGWVRMTLLGLPAGWDAKILTPTGRTLARAKPIASSRRGPETPAALALTFRPPRGSDDLLVLLSRRRAIGGDAPAAFRVRAESGAGRAPPLPTVASPRKPGPPRPSVARSGTSKRPRAK